MISGNGGASRGGGAFGGWGLCGGSAVLAFSGKGRVESSGPSIVLLGYEDGWCLS